MNVFYISDNEYYIGPDGGCYTTANLPLRFWHDCIPALKSICFWGRLRPSTNIGLMFRLDDVLQDRGVRIEFDGPRNQPSGPRHYLAAVARHLPALRRRIREADVLWAKTPSIYSALAWRLSRRVPFRLTQQVGHAGLALPSVYPGFGFAGKLLDWDCRRMAAQADLATFVSENHRTLFGKHASSSIVFHQAGVYRSMLYTDHRSPHSPFRLLFVGRISPEKGLDDLLRAVALVPDVALEVVGDGPMRDSCMQLADDLKIASRVVWPGRLRWGEPLFSRMRESDALVLPSLTEGLPQVVIEAMCMGLPVVATTVGGVPEIVRDQENGLLVPVRDIKAMACALERIRMHAFWTHAQQQATVIAQSHTVEAQWGPVLEHLRAWWAGRHAALSPGKVGACV
jgi:glycosyltransferase involved in cell wall biosynthesis